MSCVCLLVCKHTLCVRVCAFALCNEARCVFVSSQGARVWLREKDQLLPSTVSYRDDSSTVLTTDYGEVSVTNLSFKTFFFSSMPLVLS